MRREPRPCYDKLSQPQVPRSARPLIVPGNKWSIRYGFSGCQTRIWYPASQGLLMALTTCNMSLMLVEKMALHCSSSIVYTAYKGRSNFRMPTGLFPASFVPISLIIFIFLIQHRYGSYASWETQQLWQSRCRARQLLRSPMSAGCCEMPSPRLFQVFFHSD